MANTIICIKCGAKVEVTEAISAQIREQLEGEMQRHRADVEKEKAKLRRQQDELETSKASLQDQIKKGVAQEREKLEERARKKAAEEMAAELKDRDQQLAESKEKLKKAQEAELALRKKERELQQKTEELELTVNRKLDEEREKIRSTAKKQAAEEHELKDAEKEKQIADMRKQIDELKRKAEQGSQQLQGEVQELALEELLRTNFPTDTIEPVAKGVHGGDVIQRVRESSGLECGSILWESKRTKAWSDTWLAKLRDDQRAAKAAHSAIVTEAMPKGCANFGAVGDVWVTNRACILGVAAALRMALIEVARSARAADGQKTKVELLYNYLAGAEFRNRVTGIAEAFVTMQQDLAAEKRSTERLWAKREKQLERALMSTSGLYGDLQGIMGKSIGEIDALQMPALELLPPGHSEAIQGDPN